MIDEALAVTITDDVRRAIAEDLGSGDVTAALLGVDSVIDAVLITREPAVLCGRAWFDAVFSALDSEIHIEWFAHDGETIHAGQELCRIYGPARAVLSGERCAMNFVQTLSGTASTTRLYVEAIAGTGARILDTRKTLPGLRIAQKYAVRCGGGHNHRMGLYDALLIKENHIAAAGSIERAVASARLQFPKLRVEVEVESLNELEQALATGVDRILLDNFAADVVRRAVTCNAGRAELEASGGVTLENVREIAATGVDFISIGSLTKHVRAIDLSLRVAPSTMALSATTHLKG